MLSPAYITLAVVITTPSCKRFLNPDPIGEAGGVNLYGFVGNNPVSRIDPYGLEGNPIIGLGRAYSSDPFGAGSLPGGFYYSPGAYYVPSPGVAMNADREGPC